MQAVVVYESMYGNTRSIAEAIARELNATAVPVKDATSEQISSADLVVVGAPTHAWSMSRPSTRKAAADGAAKPGSVLTLEPGATGTGVREWLAEHGAQVRNAAVFDTRLRGPGILTGRASRHIARQLRRSHASVISSPQSFLVTKANQLAPGQQDRARAWAATLARAATRR